MIYMMSKESIIALNQKVFKISEEKRELSRRLQNAEKEVARLKRLVGEA